MTDEEANALSKRHDVEVILYNSDEVHVVEDSFAGDTEVPDTQVVVDAAAVVAKSEVDAVVAVCEEAAAVAERELHGVAAAVAKSEVDIVLTVCDEVVAMAVAGAKMELDGAPVVVADKKLDFAVCKIAVNVDVTHSFLHLHGIKVSTFDLDKEAHHISTLMLPIMVPCLYGEHNQNINDAATDLLWISHGYDHGCGLAEIPAEAFDNEEFEDIKLSMLKIAYPFLYENNY